MGRDQICLDPSEEALGAQQLDHLIERWLDHCTNRLDAETVAGYRRKVVYFRQWWNIEGPKRSWLLTKSACEQFEIDLRRVKSKLNNSPYAARRTGSIAAKA